MMQYALFNFRRKAKVLQNLAMCWEVDDCDTDYLVWCNIHNNDAAVGTYPTNSSFEYIMEKANHIHTMYGKEVVYFVVGYDDETGETNVYDVN